MRRHGSVLTPGDVVRLYLGMPAGSKVGLQRPAAVVTATHVLQGDLNVVQVVPLTRAVHDRFQWPTGQLLASAIFQWIEGCTTPVAIPAPECSHPTNSKPFTPPFKVVLPERGCG